MKFFYYKIKGLLWAMIAVWPFYVQATDPQFTQFYAAPLYLNPAFAGAIDCWRAGVNYRNQWFLSDRPYATYKAYIDHNLSASTRFNGGTGLYVMYDNRGAGNYQTYEIAPMVSYELELTRGDRIRFGLQPSYHLKYANLENHVFGTDINNVSGVQSSQGWALPGSANFFDVSAGMLIYNSNYWFGISAHHLPYAPMFAEPSQTLVPLKVSLHAGYKFLFDAYNPFSLTPAFNLRSQWANFQTDIGFYFEQNNVTLGAWYRGMPLLAGNIFNTDMIAALVGFKYNALKFGYSYDIPLSKMSYSWGSHEVSLIYEFCFYYGKKRKPPRIIQKMPCP